MSRDKELGCVKVTQIIQRTFFVAEYRQVQVNPESVELKLETKAKGLQN